MEHCPTNSQETIVYLSRVTQKLRKTQPDHNISLSFCLSLALSLSLSFQSLNSRAKTRAALEILLDH